MDEPEKFSFEEEMHKAKRGDGYQISVQESFPARKRDWFLPVSILVAAIVIGGAVVFSVLYHPVAQAPVVQDNGGGQAGGVPTPTVSGTAAMQLGSRDEVFGSQNAPVTIIEYGDYQCPYCTKFFTETQPSIISDYVNTGKVKMVFRNFTFLGAESVAAAQAADCAFDQKKQWAYHDALYQSKVDDETKGGSENDGFFTRALFISLAQKVGLNVSAFTSCIDSNQYADQVTQEKAAATAAGINSTPAFLINGTSIVGAQPYSQFQTIIDAALKG